MLLSRVIRGPLALALALAATAMTGGQTVASAPAAEQARRCPDVLVVWAGGDHAQALETAIGDLPWKPSVRLAVIAPAAPRLVDDDWPGLVEQGLAHPHFDGYRQAARRAVDLMDGSARRCPDTPVVLGGHSEGAVVARVALRSLAESSHREARGRVAAVRLAGDPLVEPARDAVGQDWTGGFLVGRGPRTAGWAVRARLVVDRCSSGDNFCDPSARALGPGRAWTADHYGYDSPSGWGVEGSLVPTRASASMVGGGRDVIDGSAIGLPASRLTAVRMPRGLRIQHRRVGDRIVGRARPGKQVLVVLARPLRRAPAVTRRLRIVVTGLRPAARPGTVLVTRGVDGRPADGSTGDVNISSDGSTVLFASLATNLVRQALPEGLHLFAWDRGTRRTSLVGISPGGVPEGWAVRDVSADGHRVLFWGAEGALWLRDRDARTTRPVAAGAWLSDAGRVVTYPAAPDGWPTTAVSSDGRYLVQAGPSRVPDGSSPGSGTWEEPVRVWDATAGQVVHDAVLRGQDSGAWISVLTDDGRFALVQARGAQEYEGSSVLDLADGSYLSGTTLDISADGRWLVDQQRWRVALVDRRTSERVELVRSEPLQSDEDFTWDVIGRAATSRDGSAVAWSSSATGLLPGLRTSDRQLYFWAKAS